MTHRYLLGPISSDHAWSHWKEPRAQGFCRAFNATGDLDLMVGRGDTWEDVCARLPEGWQPDFLVLWLSYTTLPSALWSAPVPLLGLASDANLLWQGYQKLLPHLDLVLTDAPGAERLTRAGFTHVRRGYLYGLVPPFVDLPLEEDDRDIDILFVGNIRVAPQWQRLPWMSRLGPLVGRYKVLVCEQVFGKKYRSLLRRARVVFNHSGHGECNQRVFEVAASGALLFHEAGNQEMADFFEMSKEYVAYDADNLEALLEHYLDHEDERRQIARAAHARVQDHEYRALWQKNLEIVAREWPLLQERAARRLTPSGVEALQLRTWQALSAQDGGDPALVSDLTDAVEEQPQDAELQNALGLAVALEQMTGGRTLGKEQAEKVLPAFHAAVRSDPGHALATLNLIEALALSGRKDLASEGARRMLTLLDRGKELRPETLQSAHFPPGFDLFRVEWERAGWEQAGRPAAETQAREQLLRWRLHMLLAELTEDLAHFHEAAYGRPDLYLTQAALGCALGRAKQPVEAARHLRRALTLNPFDLAVARALYRALLESGDDEGGRRLARDRRLWHQAAPVLVPREEVFAKAPPVGDELASILVLCCNEVKFTRLCLESVLEHTRQPYELILVDNGSTDETPAYLEEISGRSGPERVEILRNEKNLGYPAGCNQAMDHARGDYVVFLNNDTVVTEGWLERMIDWSLHSWPSVGLVGAVTNYSRPPQQVAVDYDGLEAMPAFAARRAREFAGKALRVARLTGFCLLARREVMDQIGRFDEGYGLGFFDDDDLSLRALQKGFTLLVAQDVFIHHFGSRTFLGLGVDTQEMLERNFQRFQRRWGRKHSAGYRLISTNGQHRASPGTPPEAADTPTIVAPTAAQSKRVRVSLCLIVRNEESNLPACLGSAADLFDEVIVVDTGSTDATKEIALRQGAKVFDFPWVDSFSAARNACLEHAQGDWIFWLDADDRLDEDNRAKLRALLAGLGNDNAAYSLKCVCLPDPVSGATTVVDHVRLFRNHPRIRWQYRVHEQILPAVRSTGGQVHWANIVIQHTGYQDPALRRRKLERDLRLLQMEQGERPDDPFTLFNMGSVLHEIGRHAEALPLLQRSLERSHPQDSIVRKLYALVAGCHRDLGQTGEALAATRAGRKVYPEDAELLFIEAILLREQGDLKHAEECLLHLLESKPTLHFASVDVGLRGYKARHNLGVIYQQQGRSAEAETEWRRVIAEQPRFLPGWLGLGEVALHTGNARGLEELAGQLEGLPGGAVEACILRARGQMARQEFATARVLLQEAIARFPQALGPRVVLSHAYLKEGKDHLGAEKALKDVLALAPDHAEARRNLALLQRQMSQQQAPVDVVFQDDVGVLPLYHSVVTARPDLDVPLPTPQSNGHHLPPASGKPGAALRLAVISIVHNEEDLIVPFLEHYFAQGADVIYLIDNDCTDRTRERAERFDNVIVAELRSGVLDDVLRRDTFQQYREGCIGQFDYVLLVDADELLVSREGGDLKEALAGHLDQMVLGCEGYDVIQGADEVPYEPSVPLLGQRRWGVRNIAYDKPVVLRPEAPFRLAPGQHYLEGEHPSPPVRPFYLLHFAGFDEGIFFKRRRQMTARQGEQNIARGYSAEHASQSEEDLRRRWQALSTHSGRQLLPLPGKREGASAR